MFGIFQKLTNVPNTIPPPSGCEQLGMREEEDRRTACEGGNKYLCCAREQEEVGQCWWTSCQADDWTITGCEQYNRKQEDKSECGRHLFDGSNCVFFYVVAPFHDGLKLPTACDRSIIHPLLFD